MTTLTMRVPFLDVGASYRALQGEIDRAVADVLASGSYILGEQVAAFEQEYAAFTGARYCVGVGNGLDALTLCLLALGIGMGDEVIVPSNTYIATWLAVSRTGAVPVPVEPDLWSFNIDPARIERAITPQTRAIMPVHLYGQPADLAAINAFGLPVIADAAQAHGARIDGQPIGGMATMTAWSFYPSKCLGCFGDGGAVTVQDEATADRIRRLANYGRVSQHFNTEQGINSRLDEIQAAVLRVKLPHLDEWNRRRRYTAACYLDELDRCGLLLPVVPTWAGPVWHQFVMRTAQRSALQKHLFALGIETAIHYPLAPAAQPAYAGFPRSPIADHLAQEVLSLPIGPHMTDEQMATVIDGIRSFQ